MITVIKVKIHFLSLSETLLSPLLLQCLLLSVTKFFNSSFCVPKTRDFLLIVIKYYFVTESGVRNFFCHCGKIYGLKTSLSRHLKLECGKEPKYKCPYCNHYFKRNHNRLRHIKLVHKIKLIEIGLKEKN